ncbi:MAG TPA: hypothetical protein VGJ55_14615 [Pyrinomonadaceae bacterium]|jgi:hypothetical protein
MNTLFSRSGGVALLVMTLLFSAAAQGGAPQTGPRSPSDTVREFYKAMRERRVREAFAMSIYKPAIEGLKPEEFDDLRPDFERMAAVVPETIEINGEQISGDAATVFVKVPDPEKGPQPEPVALMRIKGAWIIGDKATQEMVKKAGKAFFFNARIDMHHSEVQEMLRRIPVVETVYSQQHSGVFADLATLINVGLMPKDIEGTESTGYRFHMTLAPDAKSYSAGAEPARYGRTGRLSFFIDNSGMVKSADTGGKPLTMDAPKKDATKK